MISTISPESPSIGTVARKRRRQIIQSQRIKSNDEQAQPFKKICVEPITSSDAAPDYGYADDSSSMTKSSADKSKKPQMRYDPDVPMTKEEAANWRKEQRRKRNRESAAASRQRQRDRITELEEELSDWKTKYEEALARIERLERQTFSQTEFNGSTRNLQTESTAVSPCSSPRYGPLPHNIADLSSGVVSLQEQNECKEMGNSIACEGIHKQEEHVKHLSEMISRPAVKIAGATHDSSSVPVLPTSNESIPEPCTSLSSKETPLPLEIDPISVSPVLPSDVSRLIQDELEFDEFLLDAAEWL